MDVNGIVIFWRILHRCGLMDEVESSCSNSKEVGDKLLEVPCRPCRLVFSPYAPSDGALVLLQRLNLECFC